MNWKKLFPIIGVTIFIYILLKLDVSNIFREVLNADVKFLLLSGFFTFLFLGTQTLKWFAIAKAQKIKVPFLEAFKINLKSLFYAFITPSNIGGVIRAGYLKKYNENSLGKGLSNFTIDKIFDLCSLIFLAAIFSFWFRNVLPIDYFYYSLLIFFILVWGLLIFIDKDRSRKILRIFYRYLIPKKIKKKVKQGFYSFYEDMPEKKYFGLFFLFNILNWIVLITVSFFIGVSLGIDVSYFYYLAILPITSLISHIPITINGLGTREATMIILFGLIGVEATKIFSMSIISLFISGILPTIVAGILILRSKNRV